MELMRLIWYNHRRKTIRKFGHLWLGYLNVKSVHALQSIVNDMNFRKIVLHFCQFVKYALRDNNLGSFFQ